MHMEVQAGMSEQSRVGTVLPGNFRKTPQKTDAKRPHPPICPPMHKTQHNTRNTTQKPPSHGRHPPHPPPSPQGQQEKHNTQSAFAWTSSPHPTPPDTCTELKYKWKSKVACAKSRESAKTPYTSDAKCDTDRKTPKKTMRNGELSIFWYSVACRLSQFFARKQRRNRCENNTQN